jgi:Cys-rich repeat protein
MRRARAHCTWKRVSSKGTASSPPADPHRVVRFSQRICLSKQAVSPRDAQPFAREEDAMKRTSGARVRMLFLVGAIIGAFAFSFSWAANPGTNAAASAAPGQEIAVVGATQDDAKVQRAGEARFKKISAKEPLYPMDFLSTGRNSKIWWKGPAAGAAWSPYPLVMHGSLGEDTVFGFAGFQSTGPTVNFVGQINTGIVRFIKTLPLTEPPSTFVTVTPTARIEVIPTDRAADYMVETAKGSRTTVTVLWGKVKVRNRAKKFKEELTLTSCQEVDVEKDKDPGPIRWVSTDTMKNLITRTTIPRTLPTDIPLCERLKTEVIQRPGQVFVPPSGVVIVPVPIPVPPGKTEECPCPPGSSMNPDTHQCSCCPPGKLYQAETCSCECPCPPNHQYDPRSQRCTACREGATYDRKTCRCECPCPQGQVLLPGSGCVRECPEGYTPTSDTSAGLPHQCPVCVQEPVVKSQIPPPCGGDRPCGRCETCVQGKCMPKSCPEGLVLNRLNCECQPWISRKPTDCQGDGDCPSCQKCRDGKCTATITCPDRERLNVQTCKCEPVKATIQSFTGTGLVPTGCRSDQECGAGEVCRNGKCVKRPPRRSQEDNSVEEDSTDFGTTEDTTTFGRSGPGFHIGNGGGRRHHEGGPHVPKQGRGK